MNREQAESLLAQLVFDDLEEPVRSELLEYLKTDAALSEQLGDMRLTARLLHDAVEAGDAPKLGEQHKAELHKKIESDKQRGVWGVLNRPIRRVSFGGRYVELAAVVGLCALLVGLLLPALGSARKSAMDAVTLSDMRQLGVGMDAFAAENDGRYPESVGQLVEEGYIPPDVLITPYDDKAVPLDFDSYSGEQKRRWAEANTSYEMLALGKKADDVSDQVVSYYKLPDGKGVAVARGDGSVQRELVDELPELLGVEAQSREQFSMRPTPPAELDISEFDQQQARVDGARRKLAMKDQGEVTHYSGAARVEASGTQSTEQLVQRGFVSDLEQLSDAGGFDPTLSVTRSGEIAGGSSVLIPDGPTSGDTDFAAKQARVNEARRGLVLNSDSTEYTLGVKVQDLRQQTSESQAIQRQLGDTVNELSAVQVGQASESESYGYTLGRGAVRLDSGQPTNHLYGDFAAGTLSVNTAPAEGVVLGDSFTTERVSRSSSVTEWADSDDYAGIQTESSSVRQPVTLEESREKQGEFYYERYTQLQSQTTSAGGAGGYGGSAWHKGVENRPGVVALNEPAASESTPLAAASPTPVQTPASAINDPVLDLTESLSSTGAGQVKDEPAVEFWGRRRSTGLYGGFEIKAHEKSKDEVQVLLRQALDLQRDRKYDQALDVLDKAQLLDPDDVAVKAIKEMVGEASILVDARDIVRRRAVSIVKQANIGDDAAISEEDVAVASVDMPQIASEQLDVNGEGLDEEALRDVVQAADKKELEDDDETYIIGTRIVSLDEVPPARKPRLMPVNPWVMTVDDRLSTFALDVDTASYGIARRYIHDGFLPPRHTVRMEEFVNNFDYNYPDGQGDSEAFTVHAEAGPSPFGQNTVLLKVGVRGKVVGRDQAKPAHLVFVIDTSGSMDRDDRLPLVRQSLAMVLDQLSPQDRVSVVSYGTEANLLVEAAPASDRQRILDALENLQTGGSTNLLGGVELGYKVAQRQFVTNGVNRVILNSDGVANVGPSEADDLLDQAGLFRKQGVTFTSVGFGAGNYDDRLLEQLANKGDGDYLFVGSLDEAKRVFVDELAATRPTIAFDAKIQVDFDPARVRRYRLIGYENRDIADVDFRNDTVDAGEVGSGQSATALYELELHGHIFTTGYEPDLGTVFVRYRDAETGRVREIESRLTNDQISRRNPTDDARFLLAASAARFAEVLRGSEHITEPDIGRNLAQVQSVLETVAVQFPMDQSVQELLEMVRRAQGLPRAE